MQGPDQSHGSGEAGSAEGKVCGVCLFVRQDEFHLAMTQKAWCVNRHLHIKKKQEVTEADP